jgi:hypothetical protein
MLVSSWFAAPSFPRCNPRSKSPEVTVSLSASFNKQSPNTTSVLTLGKALGEQLTGVARDWTCTSRGAGQN